MPPFFAKFIKRASLFGWTPNSIWIRHNIVSVLATHTVDLIQCHLMCDTSVEWTPRSGCVLLIHPPRSHLVQSLVLIFHLQVCPVQVTFIYFLFYFLVLGSENLLGGGTFSIITAVSVTVLYPCVCSYNNVLYDRQHQPTLHLSLFHGFPWLLVERMIDDAPTLLPVSLWHPNFLSSLWVIFWNSTMDYKCTLKMKQCHSSLSWESVHFRVN